MTIDFDTEANEITNKLKQVKGYLDCEKIIIRNIQKQLLNGNNDENVILFLRKLSVWFENQITTVQLNADCTNYRYAAGFVDALLKMSYWKSWIKTIDR
jgi:hypothetical protein